MKLLLDVGQKRVPMFEGLFQPMHLLLILGIAVLVFGPKKLADLGKGLEMESADSERH